MKPLHLVTLRGREQKSAPKTKNQTRTPALSSGLNLGQAQPGRQIRRETKGPEIEKEKSKADFSIENPQESTLKKKTKASRTNKVSKATGYEVHTRSKQPKRETEKTIPSQQLRNREMLESPSHR